MEAGFARIWSLPTHVMNRSYTYLCIYAEILFQLVFFLEIITCYERGSVFTNVNMMWILVFDVEIGFRSISVGLGTCHIAQDGPMLGILPP